MMNELITPHCGLRGDIVTPGDKSISHRAVMFSAIAEGITTIRGFLRGADCLSTINCMRKLGIDIVENGDEVVVHGKGLFGLQEPEDILDAGNSGTTTRMLLGILAGQNFYTTLTGDGSIRQRPMGRVTKPLMQMGARIAGRRGSTYAPLTVFGSGGLHSISYQSPVASAQVKSAILLAGLYAQGTTSVTEPIQSRDHTERMLAAMGAKIKTAGNAVTIEGGTRLNALATIEVPGDISSAAFFIVAASIVPNSRLKITNVGINPTRTGIIDILINMGAKITYCSQRVIGGEPVADIIVETADLRGVEIGADIIPRLVDEIPVLSVAAAVARGRTVIRGAQELRVKESDRLSAIARQLTKMGARLEETSDGLIIEGETKLQGAEIESQGDHRMAMAMAVAGLVAKGETVIKGADCAQVSFPDFFKILKVLERD